MGTDWQVQCATAWCLTFDKVLAVEVNGVWWGFGVGWVMNAVCAVGAQMENAWVFANENNIKEVVKAYKEFEEELREKYPKEERKKVRCFGSFTYPQRFTQPRRYPAVLASWGVPKPDHQKQYQMIKQIRQTQVVRHCWFVTSLYAVHCDTHRRPLARAYIDLVRLGSTTKS